MKGSLNRVGAIVANTYREAIRMRLFLLLALAGVASLAGGLFFQEFNLGSSELQFIADFGFGSMTLLGSIMAVVVTTQLLYGEIEHRTILPLLAKPVSRGEFLAGKLIGAWLTICSFVGILALSLVTALWIRETQLAAQYGGDLPGGEAVHYGKALVFAGLQCLRLMILASVTAFFASYASSALFAIFMGFLVWMLGQMRTVAFDQLANSGSAWGYVVKFFGALVPDFRLFDLGSDAISGELPAFSALLQLGVYAGLYATLYAALAAYLLRHREF